MLLRGISWDQFEDDRCFENSKITRFENVVQAIVTKHLKYTILNQFDMYPRRMRVEEILPCLIPLSSPGST